MRRAKDLMYDKLEPEFENTIINDCFYRFWSSSSKMVWCCNDFSW